MKRIGLLVPDGVGIRNYLYSDVINELLKNESNITLLHNLSNEALETVDNLHQRNFKKIRIPKYYETTYSKFLRELISISRLKYNKKLTKNQTLLSNWFPPKRTFFHKLFYLFVEFFSVFFSSNYKSILWLEEKFQASIKVNKIIDDEVFNNNFDVIFCTHQRAMDAIPIVKRAQELSIRTVGAIYSWDNLPKARLSVRTDEYLVWSTHMKNEIKFFYPEINLDNVFITGTPQFEFYSRKELLNDRKYFFEKHKLNPNKKVICFSGDDARTSPHDPEYLEDLAKEISKLPEVERPQILFRRCPVDLSDRYDKIIHKYSEIINVLPPLWSFDKSEGWNLVYPSFDDIAILVNIAYHADVVINVASTMAHDFSIYNKPAIYINYDVNKKSNWSVNTIYKFQHFRSMPDKNSVFWLNSKKEILATINNALYQKKELSNKEWFNIIVSHKDAASKKIATVLTK